MGYHFFGHVSELDREVLNAAVATSNAITVSFETEQMGSFDDKEVLVLDNRRTGMDDIAEFVERSLLNPGLQRHIVHTSDVSELSEDAKLGLDKFINRMSNRGAIVHTSIEDFVKNVTF